jgi:hypothetical protein
MLAAVQESTGNGVGYQSWKLTTNRDEICNADDKGEAIFVNSLAELQDELEVRNPAPAGLSYVIDCTEAKPNDDYEDEYLDDDDKNLPWYITRSRFRVSDVPVAPDMETAMLAISDEIDRIGVPCQNLDKAYQTRYFRIRNKSEVGSPRTYTNVNGRDITDDLYLDAQHRIDAFRTGTSYYTLTKDPDKVKQIRDSIKRDSKSKARNEKRRFKECRLYVKDLRNLHKGMVAAVVGYELDSSSSKKVKKDEVISRLISLRSLCKRLKRSYREHQCGKPINGYNPKTRSYGLIEPPTVIEILRDFYPYTKDLLQSPKADYALLGKWLVYEQKKDKKLAKAVAAAQSSELQTA